MDRIKLLTIAVIVLLILNLGIVSFLFLSGPPGPMGPPPPEPKSIIIHQLHLDAAQQKAYEQLIVKHRGTIDSLDKHIRATKQQLYAQLLSPQVNQSKKDSLIAILAHDQQQIEERHFSHFQEIRKLCKPEQMEDFNQLTQELSRIFGNPPKPPHD